MAYSVEHISEQLFKIIKGFGHTIILFTDAGKKTVDPNEARRFYAKDIGMMVNFNIDETENEFVVNLSKGSDIKELKPMLDAIRTLAGRYIIEYTVKTFGKTITPKDFAFMAKKQTNESASKYDMIIRDPKQHVRVLDGGAWKVTLRNHNGTSQDVVQGTKKDIVSKLNGLGYKKAASQLQKMMKEDLDEATMADKIDNALTRAANSKTADKIDNALTRAANSKTADKIHTKLARMAGTEKQSTRKPRGKQESVDKQLNELTPKQKAMKQGAITDPVWRNNPHAGSYPATAGRIRRGDPEQQDKRSQQRAAQLLKTKGSTEPYNQGVEAGAALKQKRDAADWGTTNKINDRISAAKRTTRQADIAKDKSFSRRYGKKIDLGIDPTAGPIGKLPESSWGGAQAEGTVKKTKTGWFAKNQEGTMKTFSDENKARKFAKTGNPDNAPKRVEEGKWDYPKDMTKTKEISDWGTTNAAENRKKRKEWRKKQKADQHKKLMTKSVEEDADEIAKALYKSPGRAGQSKLGAFFQKLFTPKFTSKETFGGREEITKRLEAAGYNRGDASEILGMYSRAIYLANKKLTGKAPTRYDRNPSGWILNAVDADEIHELAHEMFMKMLSRADLTPGKVAHPRYGRTHESINEGFSGWHGSARKSINELGDARLVVKHKRNVDETQRGARSRQIESIFIENNEGERFKFPSTNLTAAKAMCRHVKEGGTPFDDFGQYIYEMMEEVSQLSRFQRYNKRNNFFESEQEISEELQSRIGNIRTSLKQIAGPKGYAHHFESFARNKNDVDQEKLNELRDAVTVQYFDERISESLPYVARVIEAFRTRQDKEQEIVDFARYVMKNKDDITLSRAIDLDDPESPSARRFRDPATEVAAWVNFFAPVIKDDELSNKMMRMSDTVFEVGPKHVNLALQAMNVLKKTAQVAESSDLTESSLYESELTRINQTISKYSDVGKLFL